MIISTNYFDMYGKNLSFQFLCESIPLYIQYFNSMLQSLLKYKSTHWCLNLPVIKSQKIYQNLKKWYTCSRHRSVNMKVNMMSVCLKAINSILKENKRTMIEWVTYFIIIPLNAWSNIFHVQAWILDYPQVS